MLVLKNRAVSPQRAQAREMNLLFCILTQTRAELCCTRDRHFPGPEFSTLCSFLVRHFQILQIQRPRLIWHRCDFRLPVIMFLLIAASAMSVGCMRCPLRHNNCSVCCSVLATLQSVPKEWFDLYRARNRLHKTNLRCWAVTYGWGSMQDCVAICPWVASSRPKAVWLAR